MPSSCDWWNGLLRLLARNWRTGLHGRRDQVFKRKESQMDATPTAIDLAKAVFPLTVTDVYWWVTHYKCAAVATKTAPATAMWPVRWPLRRD